MRASEGVAGFSTCGFFYMTTQWKGRGRERGARYLPISADLILKSESVCALKSCNLSSLKIVELGGPAMKRESGSFICGSY